MSLQSRLVAWLCATKLYVWTFVWLLLWPAASHAQRPYTLEKPRERSDTEKVYVSRRATQASKGILAVVLQPVIAGQVVVTDLQGRVVEQAETDSISGQAEFELRRSGTYIVKVTSPGYLATETKAKVLKSTNIIRLQLTAQYATLILPGLPPKAEVLIDDQLRLTASDAGFAELADLTPGQHVFLIRHPEYNDYRATLDELKAGDKISFPVRSLLTKVAKLQIQCLPGAIVLIDGEFQGRVNANGQVRIDYQLAEAGEHNIAVELSGYQTWAQKELLSPGPRTLAIKLEPVITSTGTTDGFESLSQWDAPAGWTLAKEKVKELNNSKLSVSDSKPGLLRNRNYRDFQAVFMVWLTDGKGATWVVRASNAKQNYYLFHLTGLKAGELTPRKLYTYRVKDGQVSEAQPPTTLTFDFKEKDSYFITITVRDNEIKHTLTANSNAEDSYASFTDTLADRDQFLYGTFGFLSFKGETFQVDDFTITPLEN
jgi:hypothetical protein